MKKYIYEFKISFLSSFHYRFNTIISLLFGNISIAITIMFWILIYQGDDSKVLNGFALQDMITYFLVGNIFRSFIINGSGFQYSNMIKNGGLNSVLVKPYNIGTALYFKNFSNIITGGLPQFILVVVLMPILYKYLSWNFSVKNSICLLMCLIISTISSHLVWSILGLMAFWIEEANAVMWSFAVLLNFISGMFIPLDFFPKWCSSLIEVLPFSSWGYIPTKIYLGAYDVNKMCFLLFLNLLWIIVLLLVYKCVWTRGIRKYSSVGG